MAEPLDKRVVLTPQQLTDMKIRAQKLNEKKEVIKLHTVSTNREAIMTPDVYKKQLVFQHIYGVVIITDIG